MDQIRYREYKVLLKPERFFAPERLEEYWKIVGHVAKKSGVGVTTNKDAFHRLIREVLFYDTKNYDLYKNAFILRKRTFYKNGWPETNHELTIKYRHPDLNTAAAVDVNPLMPGERKIKFKEELLPLKNELGGMRSLYSHNCVLYSPNIVLTQGLADIAKVFPSLQKIGILHDNSTSAAVTPRVLDQWIPRAQDAGFEFALVPTSERAAPSRAA